MNIDLTLLKDVGLSGVILLMLWQAAQWLQPRIDKVTDAVADNASTLKVLAATMELHNVSLKERIAEVKQTVDAIWDLLNKEDGK